MKTIRKIILGMILVMTTGSVLHSQALGDNYHIGVGFRAGETSGLTFNINNAAKNTGLEFIAGIWSNWLSLTGLYEIRADAFNVPGMRWYYGAGGHVAFATSTYYQEGRTYVRGDDYAIGIDGTVGLEYKIPKIPFALSVGVKPLIEVYRGGDLFIGIDPGLEVKFTF